MIVTSVVGISTRNVIIPNRMGSYRTVPSRTVIVTHIGNISHCTHCQVEWRMICPSKGARIDTREIVCVGYDNVNIKVIIKYVFQLPMEGECKPLGLGLLDFLWVCNSERGLYDAAPVHNVVNKLPETVAIWWYNILGITLVLLDRTQKN